MEGQRWRARVLEKREARPPPRSVQADGDQQVLVAMRPDLRSRYRAPHQALSQTGEAKRARRRLREQRGGQRQAQARTDTSVCSSVKMRVVVRKM